MKEHQNTEWKASWHEDYLKWIVGFANAQGGRLYLGVDDDGKVIGLKDAEALLETLPNKIRDLTGIIPEVNLLDEAGKEYLEIKVAPYNVPVSLRGQYYYRSGATKQELKGAALTEFLLRKTGRSWDDISEPAASLSDLDENSIKQFRQDASKAGRVPEDVLSLSTEELLAKLRLVDEDGNLKRAAIILFGKGRRLYMNMVVKMGRFLSDSDIHFQETEEGNLFQLLQAVPVQLDRKFFVKTIRFEGMHRIEEPPYPPTALREALLNALVHRDYAGTQIQLRVYDDKLMLWNEGMLPEGMSPDMLRGPHNSRPRNPLLAEVCYKAGYIEAWGSGTLKIIRTCIEAGLPEPEITENSGGVLVTMHNKGSLKQAVENAASADLNERQQWALSQVETANRLISKEYTAQFAISGTLARRELSQLVASGLLKKHGTDGRAVFYTKAD